MIKPDDIKKHTAEFFTSDPDFVLWCLDPERAQDGYWCGYTERHPQDLVEFERAVSLVRRVGKTHPALPSVEKQLLLDRILTDHYARCRFAAPPRRRNRAALFAAASLLVAGVVAALFWSADFTGSGLPSAEAYENITLVTREGSREVYDDIARISLTPKGEILIDGKENEGAETDRRTPRQEVRVHTSELVVPKGKRAHLQLSDGTRVWINSASVLRFPSAFGDTRDVFVEGEAYFEVAKNPERPFIVDMGNASIRVLGTTFSVKADKGKDQITAVLLEGSIRFESPTQQVLLAPDQQLTFIRSTNKIDIQSVNAKENLAWKDGLLKYKSIALCTLLNELEKRYEIPIHIENKRLLDPNVTVSGTFSEDQSLKEILQVISRSLPIKWSQRDGTYYIQ